jgi:hypothetical protein
MSAGSTAVAANFSQLFSALCDYIYSEINVNYGPESCKSSDRDAAFASE